jgi:hypothetical protein
MSNRRSRIRATATGLLAVACLVIAASLIRRLSDSPLVPLTISPITRMPAVTNQVPRGWTEHGTTSGSGYQSTEIGPEAPYPWLPDSLRNLVWNPEAEAALYVTFSGFPGGAPGDKGMGTCASRTGRAMQAFVSNIALGPKVFCMVTYTRSDRRAFDATYREVVGSVRLADLTP